MSSPELEIDQASEDGEEKPKLSLEVKVDKPSACQRHITVTVSREDVERYFNDAFTELMPNASVPGFRSGRAPRKLVESRFREEVSNQVKGSLLMDTMTQVSEEHDFSAISEPDFNFDVIEIPDDGPLTFEFDLEVRPEFDMPKWKGLKLENLTREFTKKDVDRHLETQLSRQGRVVPFDGPAEPDDYVVVNIKCRHEDKVVSEYEEQLIRLKPILSFPDGRIEDFDKLMAGAKSDDRMRMSVVISYDAPADDLQGQTVDVEFEVLEVKKVELPTLDDEMLAKLGGFENEGDLRDSIKEELERRLQYQRQQAIRQQITSVLTESADWDLPPELLKKQSGRELDRSVLELRSAGFSEDEIRAHENELRRNSLESTKKALKEHFILERIAEEEEIDADQSDYDLEFAMIAASSKEPERRVRARIEKKGLMDAVRNQIIERKVIEAIKSHAEFVDKKYQPETNETEAVDHYLCGRADSDIPEAKHGGDARELQQPADRS